MQTDNNSHRVKYVLLSAWRYLMSNIWIAFILYVMILVSIRLDAMYCYVNSSVGCYVSHFESWITESPFMNICTLFLAVVLYVRLWRYVRDIRFSVIRLLFFCFSAVWLFRLDASNYMCASPCGVSYGFLAAFGLMALSVVELLKLLKQKSVEDQPEEHSGFAATTRENHFVETYWGEYAKELVAMLSDTDLRQECMAVGISGEWGSGKTTFLSHVDKELKNSYHMVRFNPWGCTSGEQVKNEFFNILHSELAGENGKLLAMLRKYKSFLVGGNNVLRSITDFVIASGKDNMTVADVKNEIESFLTSDTMKPIAILIDDLDRLEADELFEVLRIIRVTANFKNVVYFVAYDKRHVDRMLEKRGMDSSYTDKIFNVEITLPKTEKSVVVSVLRYEISRMVRLPEQKRMQMENLFDCLISDVGQLHRYIYSFRDAKRFANVFSLNLKRILANGINEYEIDDFFWIEVLRYSRPDIYNTLRNDCTKLLTLHTDEQKSTVLWYTDGGSGKGEPILFHLFGSGSCRKSRNHICFVNSYSKYFCYRIPSDVIPFVEFNSLMLKNCAEIKSQVALWSADTYKRKSLLEHMLQYPLHLSTPDNIVRNFMFAVACATQFYDAADMIDVYGKFIRRNVRDGLACDFENIIKNRITEDGYGEKWNVIMREQFVFDELYGDYMPSKNNHLFDIDAVRRIMKHNLDRFITCNGLPPIEKLADGHSDIYRLVCAASSWKYTIPAKNGGEDYKVYDNPLGSCLVDYYQGADSDKFSEFICNCLDFQLDEETGTFDEKKQLDIIQHNIETIFGEVCVFEEFIRKCFIPSEEIDKYLNITLKRL